MKIDQLLFFRLFDGSDTGESLLGFENSEGAASAGKQTIVTFALKETDLDIAIVSGKGHFR